MNKKKNKLIPELRFPEFENEDEWKIKLLGKIASITTGSSNREDSNLDGKYTFFDRSQDIRNSNRYLFDKEAIIVPGEGQEFMPRYFEGKFDLHQRTYAIFDFISTDGKYLFYFISQNDKYLLSKAVGSTVKSLRLPMFEAMPIGVPKVNEQRKIASCLSSLDEVITAHSQKLELLKDHKKGLMQNLFPVEGKKVPNYRFPEFEKDGEWVDSTVEANCDVKGRIGYRGYTTKDIVENGNGALVLGGKHIKDQSINLVDPTFLSWDKYYESPEIMVEINDIIFSQRGTLGDCAIIEKEIGKATINPSMVLLKNIACNPKFLYYVLISETIQKEVGKQKGMGAIPMLSQKQIRQFRFRIPGPKEQQKISFALSSLDDLITAQTEMIEQLKEHKKGLMQGLFPKIKS